MKRIWENSTKMALFAHIRARKPIYLIYRNLPCFYKEKAWRLRIQAFFRFGDP